MPPALRRLSDLRPAAALFGGLALAWPGSPDVDRLRPICVAAALGLGLAALLRPREERFLPMGGFSVAMAALMAWQPLYSTLGYSLLLNLHWQAWLLGLGLLGWQRASQGGPGGQSLIGEEGEAVVAATGAEPAATAWATWAAHAASWVALGGALALRLWPGSGMVERSGLAGLTLALWGLLHWPRASGRAR